MHIAFKETRYGEFCTKNCMFEKFVIEAYTIWEYKLYNTLDKHF